MSFVPLRLPPGADLRRALEQSAADSGLKAAFVAAGIGSLAGARLRLAAAETEMSLDGAFEILSLSGTVSADGAHLHVAVADASGRVLGGHLCYGNIVRTTAEVLLVELVDWELTRAFDRDTGSKELVIKPRTPACDERDTRPS